ncbi:unnamed protein product [marine sediment metagenome]|uniref:Uncharacterized protein n=1 Tax=marine sediment metagenome TaxID=412755 RepID=X1QCZ4_9ZZZZ
MGERTLLALGLGLGLGVAIGAGITLYFLYRSTWRSVENAEEWEIVEDEHGNLKKIIVHRRVKSR